MPRPAAPDLPLSPFERVRVAGRAGCVPHSVVAYLRGRRQASTTVARVEKALRALGFGHLVRRAAA